MQQWMKNLRCFQSWHLQKIKNILNTDKSHENSFTLQLPVSGNFICKIKCKDSALYSLRVGARSWSWKKLTAEIRSSLVVAQTQEGGSYFHPGGMEGVVFPIEVDDMIHGLKFISSGDHVPFSKTSWVVPFLGSFLISWFLNSLLTTILVLTTIFMGPRFHCLHLHLHTLWLYVFGSVDIMFSLHHGDQQVVGMLLGLRFMK